MTQQVLVPQAHRIGPSQLRYSLAYMRDEDHGIQEGPALHFVTWQRVDVEVKGKLDPDKDEDERIRRKLRGKLLKMQLAEQIDVDDPRGDGDHFWRVSRTR